MLKKKKKELTKDGLLNTKERPAHIDKPTAP